MLRRWLVEFGGASAQNLWNDDEQMARWLTENEGQILENVKGVVRARLSDRMAALAKKDSRLAFEAVTKLLGVLTEEARAHIKELIISAAAGPLSSSSNV